MRRLQLAILAMGGLSACAGLPPAPVPGPQIEAVRRSQERQAIEQTLDGGGEDALVILDDG